MGGIAAKVLKLLAAGQNAFGSGEIQSLRHRFLFALLKNPCSPKELTELLKQDKTNIAHLAAGLLKDGLIEKSVYKSDRRRIRYSLDERGKAIIEKALAAADEKFANFLDSEKAAADAEQKLDDVLHLLSFL
ncbi:MAG: MarR family transcriptional regulator [Firmicutes bacterium]|nr:MarR family transcriptional regulator [Bacillota bacterium]